MLTVDLNDETFDSILVERLIEQYDYLYCDYLRNTSPPIFSIESKQNKKKIKQMLSSFERVIRWFATPQEFIEFKETYAENA